MRKTNKYFGFLLIIAILIAQTIITIKTIEMGRMAPFIAILTGMIFIPYLFNAIISLLNREKNLKVIEFGIGIGVFLHILLPIFLPLIFDRELIYLSFIGFLLGILMWVFRRKIEAQLFILNFIGAICWLLIAIATNSGDLF